jgi:hypothetical protein
MDQIPTEICCHIFTFLPIVDVATCKMVSRQFLDLANYFHDNTVRNIKKFGYVKGLAKQNYEAVVKWAHEQKFPMSPKIFMEAARNNNLPLIQWLAAKGVPCNKIKALSGAACVTTSSNLETFIWIENNCVDSPNVLDYDMDYDVGYENVYKKALKFGNVTLIDHLLSRLSPEEWAIDHDRRSYSVITGAVQSKRRDMIDKMIEILGEILGGVCKENFPLPRYIVNTLFADIAEKGNADIFNYACESMPGHINSDSWSWSRCFCNAITNNNISIINILIEKYGDKINHKKCMYRSIRQNRIEIFHKLYQYKPVLYEKLYYSHIATQCNVEFIKWLKTNHCPRNNNTLSKFECDLELIKWLCDSSIHTDVNLPYGGPFPVNITLFEHVIRHDKFSLMEWVYNILKTQSQDNFQLECRQGFYAACRWGRLEIAKFLQNKNNGRFKFIDPIKMSGRSQLRSRPRSYCGVAAKFNRMDVLEWLVELGYRSTNKDILLYVIDKQNIEMIKRLFANSKHASSNQNNNILFEECMFRIFENERLNRVYNPCGYGLISIKEWLIGNRPGKDTESDLYKELDLFRIHEFLLTHYRFSNAHVRNYDWLKVEIEKFKTIIC